MEENSSTRLERLHSEERALRRLLAVTPPLSPERVDVQELLRLLQQEISERVVAKSDAAAPHELRLPTSRSEAAGEHGCASIGYTQVIRRRRDEDAPLTRRRDI